MEIIRLALLPLTLLGPAACLAAAGVPKIAEPLQSEEQCSEHIRGCNPGEVLKLSRPAPLAGRCSSIPYPPTARSQGVEGSVLLRVHVTKRGDVVGSQLHRSSGNRELDDAAAQAAYDCRFAGGTINGIPSDMSVLIAYDWTQQAKPEIVAGSVFDAAGQRRHDEIVRELRSPARAGVNCPRPTPEFPATALRDPTFTKAEVVVGYRVAAGSGKVSEVEVLRTSGYSEIDMAALEATKKITCAIDPSRKDDVRATQTLVFRVKD